MIEYHVSFENANAHLFEVKLNLEFSLEKGQTFYLPNWIPGSYMIRDFSRNIIDLKAYSNNQTIVLSKTDKSTWQLQQDVESLEISYQVYAWDLSVRSAHLDNQHAFFNGTSLFVAVRGFENITHRVNLKAAKLAKQNHWQVATAMPSIKIDPQGFGLYQSNNYDELIDHPFEIANLETVEFDVCGVPHKMVFTEAPARVDWQRIANDVKQICETEVAFFGDVKPPFESYIFMTFVQKKGFGGLEHMASTALHCSFSDLPLLGDDISKKSPEYRGFLSLCCHEYFHNWNVKRIKPAKFIPTDLSQEQNTELLWFFEGITSYYDELLMLRAKVVEPCSYLDMLAQGITRVMRSTGRFKQTVTESSFDAWTKFYKQDENANNAIVSYYTKGAVVAISLDFEIKKLTQSKKSLDDLMRHIWQNFGKTGIGLAEKQIKQLAEELVGQSMQAFFDKALYSTHDLDLNQLFDDLDINYQIIPQYLQQEKGGYSETFKERKSIAYLGLTHKVHALGAEVIAVAENSCGLNAGLSNADIIIAIDNIRVTSNELDSTIALIPIGNEVIVSYFRRERLYHSLCVLSEGVANTCYLSFKNGEPSEQAMAWFYQE